MMLSFIAPSFFVTETPLIPVLLVIPATTTLPNSSNKTRAGRFFISNVSVNWKFARTTSPDLSTFPSLIFSIIPQLLHLDLLDFMKKFIILIAFLHCLEDFYHMLDQLVVRLSGVFLHLFERFN